MACPCCHDDDWTNQQEIDDDRDLNATEYECLCCGCQYWIETIESVTIVKEGDPNWEDDEDEDEEKEE